MSTPLSRTERRILEQYPALAVVAIVLITVARQEYFPGEIRRWQWLFISGVLTFVVAYPLSLALPGQVGDALRRLADRGILTSGEFETALHARANRLARIGCWCCVGFIELTWLSVRGFYPNWVWVSYDIVAGALFDGFLAIPVGKFIGRTIAYSGIGRSLRAHAGAGLDPVVSLYLKMAIPITLIAAFLSVWVLLLPETPYWNWQGQYAALLVGVLIWGCLTVLGPLWHFLTAPARLVLVITTVLLAMPAVGYLVDNQR